MPIKFRLKVIFRVQEVNNAEGFTDSDIVEETRDEFVRVDRAFILPMFYFRWPLEQELREKRQRKMRCNGTERQEGERWRRKGRREFFANAGQQYFKPFFSKFQFSSVPFRRSFSLVPTPPTPVSSGPRARKASTGPGNFHKDRRPLQK